MAETYFQFKPFRVHHHLSGFKVGTDGVLLGAWTPIRPGLSVLDVGTGSGLIALMLVHRGAAQVDAIDVDVASATQAADNFRLAPYFNLRAYHSGLAEFAASVDRRYDLIVSNPPYFSRSTPAAGVQRNRARHTSELRPEALFHHGRTLLNKDGKMAVIFPRREEEVFLKAAKDVGFFVAERCLVIPIPGSNAERVMVLLSLEEQVCQEDAFSIEAEDGKGFSERYRALLAPFFLRF